MRPESPNTVSRYPQFQSTHPHGVRLLCCGCLPGLYRISIHAPTRGATFRRLPGPLHLLISIHAPTRGATRRPHGCRAGPHQISIHAPTRGATMIGRQSISRGRDFNPRTHTGCDCSLQHQQALSKYFNPRTHTGCDLIRITIPPGY